MPRIQVDLLLKKILIPTRFNIIKRDDRRNNFNKYLQAYRPIEKIKPNVSINNGPWSEKIQEDFKNFINDPINQKVWGLTGNGKYAS